VVNPAEPKDIVGYVVKPATEVKWRALTSAVNNAPIWFATPPQERGDPRRAAVLMEDQMRH
jgi:RHH-type proline utilization regulon transcriptional repressor/proline dehydrogenase/delta 1-pyrroline-5-carboxylate dehydrogenase